MAPTMALLSVWLAAVVVGGQRCPDDWVLYQSSCYAFLEEYVSWTGAYNFCKILGAKMLEVETKEENAFIVSEIGRRNEIDNVWLGLNDLLREGTYRWISNRQQATYLPWHSDAPDDSDYYENGQDCVMLRSDGTWDDRWCEMSTSQLPVSPVCETEANGGAPVG